MSNSIAIAIDGPGARQALDEFFAIDGIVGEPRAPEQPRRVTRDGGLLMAIGAIVGIVGGVTSVVSNIIDWRTKWKQAHPDRRMNVVIEDAKGTRLLLDNATPEQLTSVLQFLQP
ncbi:MAG: hypothetical protein ACJ8J0_00460 [Longimicrobiaceae bacterium]